MRRETENSAWKPPSGDFLHMRVSKNEKPVLSNVIVATSLDTAGAEKPKRTQVHKDFEHCPEPKWQVKQPDGIDSRSNEPMSPLT